VRRGLRKVLTAIGRETVVAPDDFRDGSIAGSLAPLTGLGVHEVEGALEYLSGEYLLIEGADRNLFSVENGSLLHLLSATGRAFVDYARAAG
jgi:hypothetical protein